MTKTLLIAQRSDAPEYEAYAEAVAELNEKYGIKVLNEPSTTTCIEGTWEYEHIVILEYPDLETAEAVYASKEYQDLKSLRANAPPITILRTQYALDHE